MFSARLLFACSILFIISCCLLSIHQDANDLTSSKSASISTTRQRIKSIDNIQSNSTEIVIELSGQFGNHLSKIASGIAVAIELEARGRHTSISFQRPRRGHNAEQTAALLQECFPSLRKVSFHDSTVEKEIHRKKISWNSESPADFDHAMDSIVKSNEKSVLVDHLSGLDLIIDRHYVALKRFFTTDCTSYNITAYQTVFHYRNFQREMPRRGKQKGYEEIAPQLVFQLFHSKITNISSPVLIVTPFAPDVKPYVDALQKQGLEVHVMAQSTPLRDFCMLQAATGTIVGLARSTFFLWAGLLGNMHKVRAYSIDSEWKRQSGSPIWDHYNWSHPELRERFLFELYHIS